jgi:hypothetical protein
LLSDLYFIHNSLYHPEAFGAPTGVLWKILRTCFEILDSLWTNELTVFPITS